MGDYTVLEIKVLFCAPLGCIHIETVCPEFSLCTPLVYCIYNRVNKCAHVGRTCPKNVRPAAKMCAPGAECTVNFEHCYTKTVLGCKENRRYEMGVQKIVFRGRRPR